MRAVPADGRTVDLQRIFHALTLDVSTHLFLGTSTEVLPSLFSPDSDAGSRGQEFAAAFDYAQRAVSGIDDFTLSGVCWRFLFGDARLEQSLQTVHSFIDDTIEQASETFSTDSGSRMVTGQVLLYKLLNEARSREDIKYDIINLLAAGKDSMTSFMGSIWYILCQRRDVLDNIRSEISVLQGQPPTLQQLSQFSYLHMVLQEGILSFLNPQETRPHLILRQSSAYTPQWLPTSEPPKWIHSSLAAAEPMGNRQCAYRVAHPWGTRCMRCTGCQSSSAQTLMSFGRSGGLTLRASLGRTCLSMRGLALV